MSTKPDWTDFRFDIGRAVGGGDWFGVVHLPTGIRRSAKRSKRTHESLLEDVFQELLEKEILTADEIAELRDWTPEKHKPKLP